MWYFSINKLKYTRRDWNGRKNPEINRRGRKIRRLTNTIREVEDK
jgi:hypothetical protein